MKNKFITALVASAAIITVLGCGIIDTVISNTVGGAQGNTVSNLWSDVPPIVGAQKQSIDLPITVQLAIQGMIKASASSSDVQLDKFDWIAFNTNQTPQQVFAFYTNERMRAAGWDGKEMPGCTGSTDTSGGGGVCIFSKGQGTANSKGAILFMVLSQDDKTKQTQVFYIRLEGLITKTPTRRP